MPYRLEHFGDKAIVVNTLTGHHHSIDPIPLKNAKAQMRVLEQVDRKDPPMEHDDPPRRWIQEVVTSKKFKKGAFTKQAKARGKTPKGLMKEVLSHPEDYDVTTRRRAQFMKNIMREKE